MNVYDYAHQLANALKQSEEYLCWLRAWNSIQSDPKNKEMLMDFRKYQWEVQKEKLLGNDVGQDKMQRLEQIAQLVSLNPALQEYLAAEFRFARLLTDIQKILTDSLPDWIQSSADLFETDE